MKSSRRTTSSRRRMINDYLEEMQRNLRRRDKF